MKPVYTEFLATLSPGNSDASSQEPYNIDLPWQNMTHILYSVAIRLIPKADHRRKQSEQPWLDALFVSLCYFSWRTLPRLTFKPPNTVDSLEIDYTIPIGHQPEAVVNLLEVALEHHVEISLQVLSYILASALSWTAEYDFWDLVSRVVAIDVNVLIPDLGIPTSDRALNYLQGRISNWSFGRKRLHHASR